MILPFEFDPRLDYADPQIQIDLRERLRVWVERYKTHPALRLWGIGNETIHGMKDPLSPRARAFAQFLIGAADYVHALDPNHPVIYRDAEDQYLEPVAKALAADSVARPWFVYGMNFFTYRMDEAL